MRKSLCFMRPSSPLPPLLAWLKNLLCYMIHYHTYRGAVVGLRGAVVGVRGAAVGVRGAAVGNIGIPTYVISRGAVVRQPNNITNNININCPVGISHQKYRQVVARGGGVYYGHLATTSICESRPFNGLTHRVPTEFRREMLLSPKLTYLLKGSKLTLAQSKRFLSAGMAL